MLLGYIVFDRDVACFVTYGYYRTFWPPEFVASVYIVFVSSALD
jgi:hypothetical protein